MIKSNLKIGEILKKQQLITDEQIEKALLEQQKKGGRLGDVFVKLGFVTEDDIANALSKQLGILYASLKKGTLRPTFYQGLEKMIPEEYARMHKIIPLSKHLNTLTIAMTDPLDLICVDDVMKMTGCDVSVAVATTGDIETASQEFYHSKEIKKKSIQEQFIRVDLVSGEDKKTENVVDIFSDTEAAPIVKFVDLILMEAIEQAASDIHLEHFEKRASLRYRIDGILYDAKPPDSKLYHAIISRIKILARMDIAERRLPQDGGFTISYGDNKAIDVRASCIPTIFGEKIVLRLLDQANISLDFKRLGFDEYEIELLKKEIFKPYGMIFVTGPTGSGKSTTLYAVLNAIKSPKKNIVTCEDPVEYKLDGINQVQIKPLIGLNFANALRAFLRQDPDIMMVGEVRDLETAQMCIRAALTGHLVLSTLHTNDAPTAITRIMDIGIEPFLLVSGLRMVLAQRLVRKLCDCKQKVEPDIRFKEEKFDGPIYGPKGCEHCRFTGFRGRIGIFEMLTVDEAIRNMIYYRKSSDDMRRKAVESGMRTLYQTGMEKVKQGLTSFEEIVAITVSE